MDIIDTLLNTKNYWEIYEPSEEAIKNKFLELAKKYHPDSSNDARAKEVFEHISELRDEALDNIRNGRWQKTGCIYFAMKRGGWVTFPYVSETDFELGTTYVGRNQIMYRFDEDQLKFYENAVKRMKNLRFADEGMREEFTPILPRLIRDGLTEAGDGIIIIEKKKDEYPLSEIFDKLKPAMGARHIAWIISRLCNICCYLQYARISHNGLTLDNLFIDPVDHNILLYGGWWYAVPEDDRLIGTTTEVFDIMSARCKNEKRAECVTDQEMVREIAKTLAGNKSMVFKKGEQTDIPAPMAAFIRNGSGGNAFEEFAIWNNTLDLSWGKRKFVEMHIPGIC